MIRFFDIIFSFFGLIIFLPFLLILALTIVIESKGGVFYKQVRVGKNNKDFKLYKFRSMAVNADKNGLLTIGNNDSRITKVGKFIRKYKIDEFAQLINVLRGDMSLVGPRPEVRKYVNLYTKKQMQVLTIKPGISDYASIKYFNENEVLSKSVNPEETYINEIMPHKLELNMFFLSNNNLYNYFKIIFNTISRIAF
jgi:lipopolysaccharide/colanic/teichoic acid biosynthesis glycosyltransferase